MEMNRETRWLFFMIGMFVLCFIFLTYQRAFILSDYYLVGEASCDPSIESCFVYVCDASTEECTGDIEQDVAYYKPIRKWAGALPDCDSSEEECGELECFEGEYDCTVSECDSENGDSCIFIPQGVEGVSGDPLQEEESEGFYEEDGVEEYEETGTGSTDEDTEQLSVPEEEGSVEDAS